jgi:hypothetical protein
MMAVFLAGGSKLLGGSESNKLDCFRRFPLDFIAVLLTSTIHAFRLRLFVHWWLAGGGLFQGYSFFMAIPFKAILYIN